MDNSSYKVSIITVVYNGADTIEQTIKSVIGQTYKNIEYIVIDGASTDGTQKIIEKYLEGISYYISEKDDGLYHAMNKGLKKATGEIIGIINSDDWYGVSAVEDVVECFKRNDVDLAYGKIVTVSEDGKERMLPKISLESIWYQLSIPHPSVFVKKKIYDRLGVFDTKYRLAADYELLLRFYSNNIKIKFIDKAIAYFREGGLSSTKRSDSYEETDSISMSYIDKCPYRDVVMSKIREKYEWIYFAETVSMNGKILSKLLKMLFDTRIDKVLIFGTGIWSEICYNALVQTDINVTGFSDNNSVKWNIKFQGINVINPIELKNMDVYVLIAVKEHGEEIEKQLNDMGNKELKCVTIKKLKDLAVRNNFLNIKEKKTK